MSLVGKRVVRKPHCNNWDNYWGDGKNYDRGVIVKESVFYIYIIPEGLSTSKYWKVPRTLLLHDEAFLYLSNKFQGYKNKRRAV